MSPAAASLNWVEFVEGRMRRIAERLISFEANAEYINKSKTFPIFTIIEKFRPRLAILMGNGGVQALFSRALSLASEKSVWVRKLQVNVVGLLEHKDSVTVSDEDTSLNGGIEFLVQILELLEALVGEDITVGLVVDVWPDLPLDTKSEEGVS